MRIIRDYWRCPADARGAVVALGNFEGVHLGHQEILAVCVAQAKALGVPAAVMTFAPHPREFFAPHSPSLRLQSFRQKMARLAAAGIEVAFVVRFDAMFAAQPADVFVKQVLAGDVQAKHVVTGYNFAFGKGRGGDVAFLAQAAKTYGMGFTACEPVRVGGQAVSSSAVRGLLQEGRMREAAALLGHVFSIEGRVRHGDKRGGGLGYPTANVAMSRLFCPKYGVYAVRLHVDGKVHDGVANLGIRPMFEVKEPLLEVHAFDMREHLYGKRVRVELMDYLREERYFDSLDGLKAQMAKDSDDARNILKARA